MIRFQSKTHFQPHFLALGLLLPLSIFAAPAPNSNDSVNRAKNLARMNCGAQIECITPDGRVTRVTPLSPQNAEAGALIMDDDTVSCSLQEGETSFVIALPSTALLDRFTFLNENAAARGELRIAVSNYRLPANQCEMDAGRRNHSVLSQTDVRSVPAWCGSEVRQTLLSSGEERAHRRRRSLRRAVAQ